MRRLGGHARVLSPVRGLGEKEKERGVEGWAFRGLTPPAMRSVAPLGLCGLGCG